MDKSEVEALVAKEALLLTEDGRAIRLTSDLVVQKMFDYWMVYTNEGKTIYFGSSEPCPCNVVGELELNAFTR